MMSISKNEQYSLLRKANRAWHTALSAKQKVMNLRAGLKHAEEVADFFYEAFDEARDLYDFHVRVHGQLLSEEDIIELAVPPPLVDTEHYLGEPTQEEIVMSSWILPEKKEDN